jgi:hypothetical protein
MPRIAPILTIESILQWACHHKSRHGQLPSARSGPVEDAPPGTKWHQIEAALRRGLRGLPGRSSLAKLLAKHCRQRQVHMMSALTEDGIAAWAKAFFDCHGTWPNDWSGPISEAAGECWRNVGAALMLGRRGLPGGDSLAKLIARRFQVRTLSVTPKLTTAKILMFADEHHAATGHWPQKESGDVLGHVGETWLAIDAALRRGSRGLSEKSSLAQTLAQHRDVRNSSQLPKLTRRQILKWASAHHERTGEWPRESSGPIADAPQETWKAINLALHQGLRGLPGGTSLHAILVHHRKMPGRRNRHVEELASAGRGRPRSVGRRRKVLELRAQGLGMKRIAKRLGITHQAVAHLLLTERPEG